MPATFLRAASFTLLALLAVAGADIVAAVVLGTIERISVRGVAGTFFFAGVGATLVAVAIGAWWQVTAGGREGRRFLGAARERLGRAWGGQGSLELDARAAGGVLAAALLLGVFGVLAIRTTKELVLEIARPENVALANLGAMLVLAAATATLWPATRRLLAAALSGLATRLPLLAFWLPPLRLTAALAALGALGGAAVMALRWSFFSHLPWALVVRTVLGLGVGFAAWWALRSRAGMHRAVALALVLAWIGCGAASATLSYEAVTARRWMSTASPIARLGGGVVRRLLDVDRDGYASLFGDGDCAPFDPARHPGAIDKPDDGIDDDCDGAPLSTRELLPLLGHRTTEVPDSVPTRPPIVIVTADGLAARHLSAWKGAGPWPAPRARTPHLDKLANEGVTFLHAFAQGPSTRLSIPALFTSRFDAEIVRPVKGRQPFPIDGENLTLAELLGKEGYDTVAVPPTDYFLTNRWAGLLQGFDRVVDAPARRWSNKDPDTAEDIADAGIAELARQHDRPLLLWVHFYDTHSPHKQPKGARKFGKGKAELDLYDAEVEHVDAHMGRFLDAVRRKLPDALIVLSSDHASAFDAPRHHKKHYGYDLHSSVLHVPLIIAAPWLRSRRIDRPVTLLDVLPTLADVVRYGGSHTFRGNSLLGLMLGQSGAERVEPVAFHQFYLAERVYKKLDPLEAVSVRDDTLYLMQDRKDGNMALYRYREDADERDDVYEACMAQDGCLPRLQRLRRLLAAFVHATGSGAEALEAALVARATGGPASDEVAEPAEAPSPTAAEATERAAPPRPAAR